MDFELDFSSENSTMTSFLELEQEIREAPLLSEPLVRPSVIVKPRHKPTVQPSLSDIMDSCGIEYDLPGDCMPTSPPPAASTQMSSWSRTGNLLTSWRSSSSTLTASLQLLMTVKNSSWMISTVLRAAVLSPLTVRT